MDHPSFAEPIILILFLARDASIFEFGEGKYLGDDRTGKSGISGKIRGLEWSGKFIKIFKN